MLHGVLLLVSLLRERGRKSMCVCERERERERETVCVYVYFCMNMTDRFVPVSQVWNERLYYSIVCSIE